MWIDNNVWIMCSMCVDLQNAREFFFNSFFLSLSQSSRTQNTVSIFERYAHVKWNKTKKPFRKRVNSHKQWPEEANASKLCAIAEHSSMKSTQRRRRPAKSAMRDSLFVYEVCACVYDDGSFCSEPHFSEPLETAYQVWFRRMSVSTPVTTISV